MRRFLPQSLHGQMLLSVALALLVAQALAGVLLYRAEQLRLEAGLINSLAFQLLADPQIAYRSLVESEGPPARPAQGAARDAGLQDAAGRGNQEPNGQGQSGQGQSGQGQNGGADPSLPQGAERGWRRLRLERASASPLRPHEARDAHREAHLREVLEEQGLVIGELVVFSRQISEDPFIMRGLRDRPRWRGDGRWDPDGDMLVAGLKRAGESRWLVARQPLRGPERRELGRLMLIVQTLLLYVVLVGGLAFLLRRITRPLAALTRRVDQFAGRPQVGPPLEPSGPQDTRRLIAAHNAMEARISALLDEKDVMLGAIGHDLKTPLAALRVRIESVEDSAEREKMARTIADITLTLDDILSLARVGRPEDQPERTDLGALVASVVEEYEDMGEDVELGTAERIAMPLRATWLRRAIRNLVGNALRYGDEARICVRREGDEAVIRITDKGPGIPEDEIAGMLEPFARGEGSRNRATGGAGLGLTLARAIAEQHGGRLVLKNRPAGGLEAQLRLPV